MTNDSNSSYLIFKMESEFYAVNVNQTLKVLELSEITKIPNSLPGIKGVINQHGNVLPVIDLKKTLLNIDTTHTKSTCIIVFSIKSDNSDVHFGAIVQEAIKVIEISDDKIDPPPTVGNKKQFKHLSGTTKSKDHFVMILDIDYIFKDITLNYKK